MMKIKFWTRLINLLLVTVFLLIGCKPKMISGGGNNSNSSVSNSDFYTSFFVNDSVSTYFIKPLKYKNEKTDLSLDITYQQINQNIENVIVKNNTVEIIISGNGDFEYSIDGTNFQDSNFFHLNKTTFHLRPPTDC